MNERIKPRIFIPKEKPQRTMKKEVYLEQNEYFDILWYHWPRDGYFPEEDFEPIILLYCDKINLSGVVPRRHWNYNPYKIQDLSFPIELVFDGIFHPPFVRHKNHDFIFSVKTFFNPDYTDYDLIPIKKNNIPEYARTGKGHTSLNLLGRNEVMDPCDKAMELYSEFCKN